MTLGRKQCTACGEEKDREEFQHISRTKGWASQCRECANKARRARYRLSADAVSAFKLERGCADCGYNEHPAALQFDHRPGTVKLFDIARHFGRKGMWEEIAKCDVVCANCHAVRTATRRLEVAV